MNFGGIVEWAIDLNKFHPSIGSDGGHTVLLAGGSPICGKIGHGPALSQKSTCLDLESKTVTLQVVKTITNCVKIFRPSPPRPEKYARKCGILRVQVNFLKVRFTLEPLMVFAYIEQIGWTTLEHVQAVLWLISTPNLVREKVPNLT